MKKKKQIKIIISLLVMIAVLLGGVFLVRQDRLKAENSHKEIPQRIVYNIPQPAQVNKLNLGENFSFVKDAGQVVRDEVTQSGIFETPPGSYDWSNVVQMVEQNDQGEGVPTQRGALWYINPVSLKKNFEGVFESYFGNKGEAVYDGISITLQNDKKNPLEAIGGGADGFGVNAASVMGNDGQLVMQDQYVGNAVSVIIDGKENSIYVIIPTSADKSGSARVRPRYNYRKINTENNNFFSNGSWHKFIYSVDVATGLFSYQFIAGDEIVEDSINLNTGETTGPFKNVNDSEPQPIPEKIPEIADKGGIENYFEGDSVYWGFTGSSHGTLSSLSMAPLVSVELSPNQSQSPLQLSMTKLGEIGSDGTRQPLAGAKFILQAQNADGTWQQFNPEKTTKDVAEVFTTGTDGKIVIKATDNQKHADLIDLVLKYGGLEDYQAFRFREVEAAPNPTGDAYLAPPAIDPNDPTNYAASKPENSAALFTTKSVKLSGASTTPTDPTTENPDAGDFGTVYNSNQNWLPYYKPGLDIGGGGWLDSMTSYIPKDSVFTMMWNENSKLVEWSDSVSTEKDLNKLPKGKKNGATPPYDVELEDTVAFPTSNTEAKWFRFENVGFHDGKSVGVKITIQTQKAIDSTYEGLSYIRYGKEYFLRVTTMAGTGSPTVTYQFLDENGDPFQEGLSGYTGLGPITYHTSFKIPIDEIKNLYSVNREFTFEEKGYPTLIKYQVENNLLDLTSAIPVPSTPGVGWYLDVIQTKVTRTFPPSSTLTVTLYEDGRYSPADYSAQAVFLNPDTDVKIEFPDPQPTRYTYTEIIDSDDFKGIVNDIIKPLNYGFIQQIPWEGINEKFSINNRTQTPIWNLTAPEGNTTLIATDWEAVPQDNPTENTTTWFDMTGVDSTGNGSMFPKAEVLSKDEFYNHYYEFNRGLTIDYNNPIMKDTLTAKDKGYYYDYSGEVKLNVKDEEATAEQTAGMNKNREEVKYDTAINFLADDVQYKYLDQKIYEAQIAAGNSPSEARAAAAIDFSNLTWGTTPQPSGKGQAIVTWQVPLTPTTYTDENLADPGNPGSEGSTNQAPTIPGYEYVTGSAELNAQTADYQVKVTKFLADGKTEADATAADYTKPNEVVLFYEPQGDVEIEDEDEAGVTTYLADDIDFGNITVPTASTITKAPEANNGTDKDQYPSLVVKDTRLKNYREAGWTLYVTMTEPFRLKKGDGTFDENETIDNILKYKNNFNFIKDGTATVPTGFAITKGDKIPIESLIPTETQLNETIWRTQVDLGAQKEENGEASKGFYLEINKPTQLGIKAGEYQAELTFSVENSAFTTPTP